jgi:ABC-type multidrug transport system ATPase subunit
MAANEGPHLIIDKGPDVGRGISLTDDSTTIGRTDEADAQIEFTAVSRQHARFEREGDAFYVVDLGSSNGTFLNGERIEAREKLQDGDQIGLGQSVLVTFRVGDAAEQEDEAPAGAQSEGTAVDEGPPPDAQDEVKQDVKGEVESVPLGATAVAPSMERSRLAATTVGDEPMGAPLDEPPVLRVTIAGEDHVEHTLKAPIVVLGRDEGNDVVIPSPIVSRQHARLERMDSGYQVVAEASAANPIMMDGKPLEGAAGLHHGAVLRIGGRDPGSMVTLEYISPAEAAAPAPMEIDFAERTDVQIGRGADNDVVLDAPSISRYHARVERIGKRFRVQDLNSTNGTFVNGEAVTGVVSLDLDDEVRIGPYRFVIGEESLEQYDDTNEIRVEVRGLNKWVRKDLNILKNLSMVLQPREFVVVVGQSGGGKSTFVDAVAGYRPATHGQVMVNDVDVYRSFDSIRNIIGYVPQKDIIHSELTVYEALDYAAQLRMPSDTTKEERHARILEVLDDLDIAHRKDVQISGLSGGQQKRVSIGVELLTKPSLFFLDEPSSGLDPGTETALMQLMRLLADQGRTIILITHATKNVLLADQVVFLARGGYLAWFGPPDEALDYFDNYRSERDRRAGPMEFDDIYALLADPSHGDAPDWAERYQQHPAYLKNVIEPFQSAGGDLSLASAAQRAVQPVADKVRRQVSTLRQFLILSARNMRILTRDRFSLALMLAAAPIVGLLDVVLAVLLGRSPFDFVEGNIGAVLITMFLLAVYGVMVGGLSQMREIVKEGEIYRRERLVNLKILPYVSSKVWVAGLFALYQAAAYTIIHYLAFRMPGGVLEFFLIYFTLALATMAGMMLGLFASALSPTANAAPMLVIIFMIPQIVLGGAVVPLPPEVSAITSTSWAFRAFMNVTGPGSDVAADVCFALPLEQRQLMSTEDKLEAGCSCVGPAALKEENCDFPAVGQFYNPAIDSEPPDEPPPPPERPLDPDLPEPPQEPEDQSDAVAVAEYLDSLEAYQAEVESIQSAAEADFADYESELGIYQAQVTTYQQERIEWQLQREAAIQPVEGLINATHRDFGWTFVNKEDPVAYWPSLLLSWGAQGLIIGILFVGTLIMVKRKDVN